MAWLNFVRPHKDNGRQTDWHTRKTLRQPTRRVFAALIGASISLIVNDTCLAADLGVFQYQEPLHPHESDWTGFYGGLHAGYQTGRVSGLLPAELLAGFGNTLFNFIDPIFQGIDPFSTFDPLSPFAAKTVNYNGAVAGAHFGYDYQYGPFVLGTFLSASWLNANYNDVSGLAANLTVINIIPLANVDVTASGTTSFKRDMEARIGARTGLAFERLLIYGMGGFVATHAKYELNNTLGINVSALAPVVGTANATLTTFASSSHLHPGFFFRAGAEFLLTKNLSLGIEWQRADYETISYDTQTTLKVSASAALNLAGTNLNLSVPGQVRVKIQDEDECRVAINDRF